MLHQNMALRIRENCELNASLGKSKYVALVGQNCSDSIDVFGVCPIFDGTAGGELNEIVDALCGGFTIVGVLLPESETDSESTDDIIEWIQEHERVNVDDENVMEGVQIPSSLIGWYDEDNTFSWNNVKWSTATKSFDLSLELVLVSATELIQDRVCVVVNVDRELMVDVESKAKIDTDALSKRLAVELSAMKQSWSATTDGDAEQYLKPRGANYLFPNENDCVLGDLWSEIQSNHDETSADKKHKAVNFRFVEHNIMFDVYDKITGDLESERLFNCAPIIQTQRSWQLSFCGFSFTGFVGVIDRFYRHYLSYVVMFEITRCIRMPVKLECYTVCDAASTVADVRQDIAESVQRAIRTYKRCLIDHIDEQNDKLYIPRLMTFLPPTLGYFVTSAFPRTNDEKLQAELRKDLHHRFALPTDQPALRTGNQFRFHTTTIGPYLRNVHENCKMTSATGGSIHVVPGTYTYHHYMQDGMDDSGWGCAYRSVQTIVSWLLYQGYTDSPIPTHREMQQALVDIGDREPKFLGSRQWIGSLECSYVLDHLLGVQCQILTAQTGADMADKARQLAVHFDTDGVPVMIGGGVLAHTILGVDFNEDTGDVRFLVLDPHYDSPVDDVKAIVKVGWCGWKPLSFWRTDTFYNMCLPKRPNKI